MKYNIGFIDLLIRFIVGLALIILYINGNIPSGVWTAIAWLVAIIFIGTAAMGKCPLYHVLGISSKKNEA